MQNTTSQENALAAAALRLQEGARAAFLDAVAAQDPALRERIRARIDAEQEATTPDITAAGISFSSSGRSSEAKPGESIGCYKIREKIGEGGCGAVFVADQEKPVRRQVAIKVIKLGMDTEQVVARFEAERQALAIMEHPNIARVLDGGSTGSGRPYFVMEFVRGTRITEYCDRREYSVRQRIGLFIEVCHAIQHAHQKGIVHRDIKPSNILVAEHEDRPVPKVIDFGIAKAAGGGFGDAAFYTQMTQLIGTPAYMSPEQAGFSGADVDTRSDIYSLGALLYELLTGQPPFPASELLAGGLDRMTRTIREKEPLRPSVKLSSLKPEEAAAVASRRSTELPRLKSLLKDDLDWIVMKCLEKDRSRRYETANGLAADLKRHLNREPVVARSPTTAYRFKKMVRRNMAACVGTAAAVLLIILGGAASFRMYWLESAAHEQAARAEKRAQAESISAREAEALARRNLYASDMNLAHQEILLGNLGHARALLREHWPQGGEPDLRGFEWRYLWNRTGGDQTSAFADHSGSVVSVAWSPDGKWIASGGFDGSARIRTPSGQSNFQISGLGRAVSVSFSAGSDLLAIGSSDNEMRLVNVADGRVLWTQELEEPRVVFSPRQPLLAVGVGGDMLAAKQSQTVQLWDASARKCVAILPESGDRAAFSPDGTLLATENYYGRVSLFDVHKKERLRYIGGFKQIFGLSFSPDGKTIAIACKGGEIHLWRKDEPQAHFLRNPAAGDYTADFITAVAFSPDGKLLAASRQMHEIELWDLQTSKRISRLLGHGREVWSVAFSPDGSALASASFDGTVRIWDPFRRVGSRLLDTVNIISDRPLTHPVFTPDSRYIVVRRDGNAAKMVDVASLKTVQNFADQGEAGRITPDGKELVSITFDGKTVTRWDLGSGRKLGAVSLNTGHDSGVFGEDISDDCRCVALKDVDNRIFAFDASSGSKLNEAAIPFGARCIHLSPDAKLVAAGGNEHNGELIVYDFPSLKERWRNKAHGSAISRIAFTKDHRLMATACWDSQVRVWEAETGKLVSTLTGHKAGVLTVAFSNDGKTLASASDDYSIKLWHVATSRVLATINTLLPVVALRFSPDDLVLIASDDTANTSAQLFPAPIPSPASRGVEFNR